MVEGTTGLRRLLAFALVIGVTLRLMYLEARPSLYIDEARLALNIASRAYGDLAGALDYDQSAPLLFLWTEKAVADLAGYSDLVLRVIPMAAGIALVFLQFRVARQVAPFAGAVLATLFAAVSPALLEYAGAAKQYSTDALVSMVLLAVTLPAVRATPSRTRLAGLLGLAVVAPWLSAPSVFVLAGVLAALAVATVEQQRPRTALVLLAGASAASGLAAYLVTYRWASRSAYLNEFWSGAFLWPVDGHFGAYLRYLAHEVIVTGFSGLPAGPVGYEPWERSLAMSATAVAFGAMLVVGAWRLRRERGTAVAALLLTPLAGVLAAAVIKAYPLAMRTLLFAVPILYILGAIGLGVLAERLTPPARRLGYALVVGGMVLLPLGWCMGLVINRQAELGHVRALVEAFEQQAAPDEPVYVFAGTLPAWVFYTTDWRYPDRRRLAFMAEVGSSGGPAFENAPPRRHVVEGEGAELVYQNGARKEILGIPAGIPYSTSRRALREVTDRGWPRNEVGRIRAAASPYVWVIFAKSLEPELRLVWHLGRSGAVRVYRKHARGAYLYRYLVPESAAAMTRETSPGSR
jgi:hypothetical protein